MPVNLTTPIPSLSFSRNPIALKLQSDDYVSTSGVAAQATIIFNNNVAPGQLIHLSWAYAALVLTASDNPDNSGLQFPSGAKTEAYVRSVMAVLQQNYYIDRDFILSYYNTGGVFGILMVAKITGSNYSVFSANDTAVTVTQTVAGVTQVIKPNFTHKVQVWIKQNGADRKIYDSNLQLDYPIDGSTTIDISRILHSWLKSDVPALSGAVSWQACSNTILQYYIKYGQSYGDTPTVGKIITSVTGYVTINGLSVQAALNQTITGYLMASGKTADTLCLRQGSKLFNVQPGQPEWLYWINLTGADINVRLQIAAYCSDGTVTSWWYGTQMVPAWQKYHIPTGYSQINVKQNLPTGKTCSYYTAQVVSDQGQNLSAIYTYVLDAYREFPAYFVYLNSLGGYQTLYTYGKTQFESDRTKDDVTLQVTYSQAAVNGRFLEANVRLQDKCTVNTGYKTKREIALLRDFLESTEKYWVNEGRLVPIGIQSDNLKQPLDGENLPVAQFVFYPLYDEFVYTDDADQADDPNTAGSATGTPVGYNAIIDDDNNDNNPYYEDL